MVVVGGRAPQNRWGSGSLQELDQPPIIAPISKLARTIPTADDVVTGFDEAFTAAAAAHRGPAFVDVPMDEFFNQGVGACPPAVAVDRTPDPDAIDRVAALLGAAERPVVILGTDVWADRAEVAALRLVEALGLPAITNGMGRGVVPGRTPPAGHQGPRAGAGRCRPRRGGRDAARLPAGLRRVRRKGRRQRRRAWCTWPTPPTRSPAHAELAASAYGDLSIVFDRLLESRRPARPPSRRGRRGPRTCAPGSPPPSSATPPCCRPRPTRSTRPASTASSCRAWPTTPW